MWVDGQEAQQMQLLEHITLHAGPRRLGYHANYAVLLDFQLDLV